MENKKVIERMYNGKLIQLTFDKEYKEWMQLLITFMRKVGSESAKFEICPIGCKLLSKPESNFLGTSRGVASQFFYFLMKDELSECTQNFALDVLCEHISTDEGNNTITSVELEENRNYMIQLVKEDFNKILIGQIYDFYVSMWSCFETSILSMALTYEEQIIKKLSDSRFRKIKNIYYKNTNNGVKNYSSSLDNLRNEIDKKVPIFLSFPDKTNYLFNEVLKNYKRDKKKDKDILSFAAALRNTMHNNGVHLRADKELNLAGCTFKLKQNDKVYFERYRDIMILVNELFDIYLEMIKSNAQNQIY